ncbi:MAG: hypothetical protein NTZ84_00120 [Candidatus Nealsonbacteria bacterium]|nr:hypothetical protein [Candidatus Nealsonbacteria bacterium]
MQKITKKIIIGIVTIAFAATIAAPASAATVDELQAMINNLLAQINSLQAQLGAAQGGTIAGTGNCAGITFSRSLKLGMAGNDVKCLQSILNQGADTQVSVTGAGAPGAETTYFGAKTQAAVIKFQVKYASEVLTPIGLTAGTGFVGARTIAKLNTMIGSGGTVIIPGVTVATAALASDNPVASAVPTSAGRVPLLKVRLQASGQDVLVNSLTFKRTGVGASSAWEALYLYVDDVRVTTYGRTISVDDQTVEFPTLSFTIPAGQVRTITLRGDVLTGATAGGQSAFQLISSNVAFAGLPVIGNTFTIGGVGVGTVTLSAGNSVTSPMVGAQGAPIGSFKVTAGTQDVDLRQVIFTITGTIARANVTNIKLYYEDQLLGQASGVDTYDNAVITLTTPFTIAKTLIKTFTVKADLGGKAAETVIVKILENGDVLANDKVYGFGSIITGAGTFSTTVTLKGGTVSLQDLGPVTGKVSKSSQDVTLTKIGVTSNRSVEVIKLGVLLTAVGDIIDGDDTTLVTDLRIKDADTGTTLMTGTLPTTATSAGITVIPMTGSFSLAAGTTRNLIVTVDIGNGTTLNSATIKADLYMMAYSSTTVADTKVYIRDTVTGDYVKATEIVPQTVFGDYQTIEASSLSVALNSNPISQIVVTGGKDVPALGILLTAGAGSDVNVRQIDATVRVSTSSSATTSVTTRDKVQLVKLYDGTTLLSQKVLDDTGTAGTNAIGTVQFDGLNIDIVKNTSKVLTVKIDTASNLTTVYYASVAITTSTVDAKNANGDTIAATGGANTAYAYRYVTIETKGTLAATAKTSATPISANLAVGKEADGKAGVDLLAFDLTSTKEDIKVTKIAVAQSGSGDGSNYKAIYLYDGSTMVKATVFPYGTTTAKFDNLAYIVPANTTKTLTIKADLSGIDAVDVISGEVVKISLIASSTLAIGNSSGMDITMNGVAPAGNEQYVYKSVLEAKLASNSPSGLKSKGAAQDVMYVDLTNVGAYDAFFASTTFTIGYTAGTGGHATTSAIRLAAIYDSADPTTALATGSVAALVDLTNGTTTFTLTPSTAFSVGAGQTKTLVLKFDTTDVGSSGGAAFTFSIASVGNFSWYDGYGYVQARTRYLPIVGGTITY